MTDLAGQHALVTGASRGIGAAVARELARSGARVTLLGRTGTPLEGLADEIARVHGVGAFPVVADVTDAAGVERAVATARAALGEVTILVNNAGGAGSAAFLESDDALWRRMLDVNLMGAVFCTRAVLPAMRAARAGSIVNMASTAALEGYRYVSAYCAAKHALLGLTRSLASELARDGIRVNAVCPAYTDTDMLDESARATAGRTGRSADDIRAAYAKANASGRLVTPAEVAEAVRWLCDDAQRAINGDAIVVDGRPWTSSGAGSNP